MSLNCIRQRAAGARPIDMNDRVAFSSLADIARAEQRPY